MYIGIVGEWINNNERKYLNYHCVDNKELITNYLELLKFCAEPLYPHECSKLKNMLDSIEPHISDKIFDDLRSLGDKDLIIKYDLEPKTVSSKYCSYEVKDIKPSLKRLDIDNMRNGLVCQYEMYDKRGWL